ncbi:cysteine--tRNA ligase [Actinomycetes bacterium]|nr:cysteine--tRNA ligase [Actinomycetes bacterium]
MKRFQLSIYDTKSRSNQIVRSTNGREIRIYCCGPTVYRDAHVGNLRTFLLSDLVVRTLNYLGVATLVVQNITDVGHMTDDHSEDKLLSQSIIEKVNPIVIARKYEEHFKSDLIALNIRPADHNPRASECIEMMQTHISKLIELGSAYIGSDQTVYFAAESFPTYGALSGNRLDQLKPGRRYDYQEDGAKKFHADWALWKAAGNRTDMVWDSPWGVGFPGWHIECSAMSLDFLNGHVDLHIGGIDLRFPHHENERAQSNAILAAVDDEVVDLWLHGEHLLFEGRKMAKSSGNVVLISDVLAKGFDPLAVRFCFLENRYRSQMDLDWTSIAAADETLNKWRSAWQNWIALSNQTESPLTKSITDEVLGFFAADLDTPRAMQVLRQTYKRSDLTDSEKSFAISAMDQLFGLDLTVPPKKVKTLTPEISVILKARLSARLEKNYKLSDELRLQLTELGVEVQDKGNEQEWRWLN